MNSTPPPADSAAKVYRRLLGYARPHRGMFMIGVLGMALFAATDGTFAFFVQKFVKGMNDVQFNALTGEYPLVFWLIPIGAPVLFLTTMGGIDDRVTGLEAGGDDYLTKPFAFAELLARVQALIRRATGSTEPTRLTVGDLSIDLLTRRTERAGTTLDLRPREFTLLEYLMRNPGRVISKTMILSQVWGYNFNPGTNVVDVLVSRLRDKVDEGFDTRLIHTVRGAGYVLKVD